VSEISKSSLKYAVSFNEKHKYNETTVVSVNLPNPQAIDKWQLVSAYDLFELKFQSKRFGLFNLLTDGKPQTATLQQAVYPSLKSNLLSFFSNKRKRVRYLFDNFHSAVESNPLVLTFNLDNKKRLSTDQFHSRYNTLKFLIGRDNKEKAAFKSQRNGGPGKIDIATMSTRRNNDDSKHRVIHITGVTTPLIEINDLDIHYPLPMMNSTSPGVNADTLGFFIADAEFTRLKDGFIHMHIPVAEKIDRLTPKRYIFFMLNRAELRCLILLLILTLILLQWQFLTQRLLLIRLPPLSTLEQSNKRNYSKHSLNIGRKSRKKRNDEYAALLLRRDGAKPWVWSEGEPLELKYANHLSRYISTIDNPDAKPSAFWRLMLCGMMVIDPGFYFARAAYNVGTGKIYLIAPNLSGIFSMLMKLRKEVQTKRDTLVNEHGIGVKEAKAVWEAAKMSRARQTDAPKEVKKELFDAVGKAKKEYDIVLDVRRKDHRLTKRMNDLDRKMEHEVRMAREATAYFLSKFEHVLEPNFSAGKSMLKKGKTNSLSKYWKSKGQRMGHAETRNVLIRRLSRKGGCFNMPSESFSTQHCACGTLSSPGIFISL
jgi:hypothetical protein